MSEKTSYEQIKDDGKGCLDTGCMTILVVLSVIAVVAIVIGVAG